MSGDNFMTEVLQRILELRKDNSIGQEELMVTLSLLNLMGIVGYLNRYAGVKEQLPFDPSVLMKLLGKGEEGSAFDLAPLMSLLGNFLGGQGVNLDSLKPAEENKKEKKTRLPGEQGR